MSRVSRQLAARAVELGCILATLACSEAWAAYAYQTLGRGLAEVFGLWAIFGVTWILISKRLGVHSVSSHRNLAVALKRTFEAWAATWGICGLLTVTAVGPVALNIWLVLAVGAALLAFVKIVASHTGVRNNEEPLRAVVIGACPSAHALSSTQEVSEAVEFIGFVPFTHEAAQNMPHLNNLGTAQQLTETLRNHEVDIAFVCPSQDAITGEVHQAITTCEELGMQTQYFPSFLDVDDLRVSMTWSANRPGLNVQVMPKNSAGLACKRAIDIAGSAIGGLILLPALVACAIAIKLTSRGPVFYHHKRIGKSGRSFSCLKFRTMRVGTDSQQETLRTWSLQDGPAFKLENDPRITPVGQFLRKFSIDELPQLLNVLRGDMSLVGPRPPLPSEVVKYTWWQRRRIAIKPGLTCIWQVYGRNRVSFKRWVEMDLYYIDNWSIWLDIKLIARTFGVVARGTGM